MVNYIYHMTLKLLQNHSFGVWHLLRTVKMDVIA